MSVTCTRQGKINNIEINASMNLQMGASSTSSERGGGGIRCFLQNTCERGWPKTDQNEYWPPTDHFGDTAQAGVKSRGGFDNTTLLVNDIPMNTFNLNPIRKKPKTL